MSAFAGIVSRGARAVPEDARRLLRRELSRRDASVLEADAGTAYFVRLADDPLGTGRGLVRDGAGVTVLAGDPLFPDRTYGATSPLSALRHVLARDDTRTLAAARGTFCGAPWLRAAGDRPAVLRLVVDAMGVRPIYVA